MTADDRTPVGFDPDGTPIYPTTVGQLGLCGPRSDDPEVGPDAARHTPPVDPAGDTPTPGDLADRLARHRAHPAADSLYGRCTVCGLTWSEQTRAIQAEAAGRDRASYLDDWDEGFEAGWRAHEQLVGPGPGAAAMLAEFHAAFDQPYGHGDITDSDLRIRLHREETKELVDELEAGNLAGTARELADVVYVAYGTAHSLGIPLDAVLREVHRANMTKFPGGRVVLDDGGKVLKPAGFTPPDIAGVLAAAEASDV